MDDSGWNSRFPSTTNPSNSISHAKFNYIFLYKERLEKTLYYNARCMPRDRNQFIDKENKRERNEVSHTNVCEQMRW